MEVAGLKVAREQLRNAFVVIYSLVVMAAIIPGFSHISTLIALPYFLVIPGYFVTLLLRHSGTLLERLFYTFAWSIAIFTAVTSIETIVPNSTFFPVTVIVPALTILLMLYDHYHRPVSGA